MEPTLDSPVLRERNPMLDEANRLKLAVFCVNVARGTSISFAESLPKASWAESPATRAGGRSRGDRRFHPARPLEEQQPGASRGRPLPRAVHVGRWAGRPDGTDQPLRNGAHDALSSDHRCRHVLDHRPHLRRALLDQRRGRLQRARVPDVRDRAARARRALRLRRRVALAREADLDVGGRVRLQGRVTSTASR